MRRFLLALTMVAATASPLASQSFIVPAGMPVTHSDLQDELDTKLHRVEDFLKANHLEGVLLTNVENVSWITAGLADSHIVITSEGGGASLLILRDGRRFVIGEKGEVSRMMHEDLVGLGYQARPYIWYQDQMQPDRKLEIVHELAQGSTIGTDMPYADLKLVASAFAPLRYQLTESEIKKYRALGPQVTEAVIATCRKIHPGMSEREIEAVASDELMHRGIRPTVLLMGVDHRVFDYWHHTPTDLKLQHYAIVNVCARRWGLVVSVARFVYFGDELPEDLRRKQKAAMEISAMYQAHSRPGVTAGDMLKQAEHWFAEAGFPGGVKDHHQGGAIGYAEREWIAYPGSPEVLHDHQAFAWNPIVLGTLSFDTILINGKGIENLTTTPDWPAQTLTVDGRKFIMPEILVRPDPSSSRHKNQ